MHSVHSILFLSIFAIVLAKTFDKQELTTHRNGKFLGIWGVGVVRFKNDVCNAADGLSGTCYTKRQCSDIDGIPSGGCASNIGVCCVVQQSCGGVSAYNNTYFINKASSKPTTSGGKCVYTIQRCSSEVCSVRIDFLTSILSQPDANGTCASDVMKIVGSAYSIPELCGDNTGQHIYADFYGDEDIKIVIYTSSDVTTARTWRIKVTQIGCDCPERGPKGCLQYHTGLTGTVKSFNYGKTGSSAVLVSGDQGTRQLANLNYGICVRQEEGYCGIQWKQAASASTSFSVSGSTTAAIADGTVGTADASVTGTSCTADYIVIPNAVVAEEPALATDRFCGNGLPVVTTYSRPFVLTEVTNGDEIGDAGNIGFALTYTQLRCTGHILCG